MMLEQTKPTLRYGFLLVNNYSMVVLNSAIEPLRIANRLSNNSLYEWPIFTLDGDPVVASNGLMISSEGALSTAKDLDVLFICAGAEVSNSYTKKLDSSLKKLALDKVKLGGLCTGTYLLARAGLLDGYKCAIHWDYMACVREEFYRVVVNDELFVVDRDRFTCAGDNAPLDMMLALISENNGVQLSTQIAEQFMCDRVYSRNDSYDNPIQQRLEIYQPRLIEAISLMQTYIEEPVSIDELSKSIGISVRQLERLFKKYLSCVPTRYYMGLRLNQARRLLLQTSKSIIDISLACGFVSSSHFSKCYKGYFGSSPRDERIQKLSSVDVC
jgi:transcriptional regulator GlxA family with amidase domain